MAGMFSAQTLADENKTGFYVTGKAGVSVMSLSEQRFVDGEGHGRINTKAVTKVIRFWRRPCGGIRFYQHYNVPVRTEVEFYGRGNAESKYRLSYWESAGGAEFDDAQNKLSVNTLMLNAYYDFRNSSAFTPWISAGLGYARVHHKTSYIYTDNSPAGSEVYSASASKYENNPAWSPGAGVKYDVTQDFSLDLSYRYLDAGDSTLTYKDEDGAKYKSSVDVRSNEFMLGATYNF